LSHGPIAAANYGDQYGDAERDHPVSFDNTHTTSSPLAATYVDILLSTDAASLSLQFPFLPFGQQLRAFALQQFYQIIRAATLRPAGC
jgi:hypothetical protein